MPQTAHYPRLYTALIPGGEGEFDSRGDQTVTQLYTMYASGNIDSRPFDVRARVLDCALRLFGDFDEWMIAQRNNPQIGGSNLEFLRDTLNFIATGQRNMNPLTWFELLAEKADDVHQHHLTHSDLALPKKLTTEQVIQLWCSHQNGWEDLLLTLFVLFGTPRVED